MIPRLRRRFVAAAMLAVVIVLGLIMAAVNVVNYLDLRRSTGTRLDILAENGGSFPRTDGMSQAVKSPRGGLSPEAPFDTRYFSVIVDDGGDAALIDTGRIAAVSTETAAAYAESLWAGRKTSGFWGVYRYQAQEAGAGTMYIFLDCSRELQSFRSFLLASLVVSAAGLLLVFLLVLLLSGRAVRPMAESYEKQRQFITDASHEIKTPLTIIDADAEVLEPELGGNEWLKSIRNQVARLTGLTRNLVLLSRMEEGGKTLTMVDFSLSDAVLETAQSFAAVAETREMTLQLCVEPGLSLCGNEAAIRQLVSILLDNALRYGLPGTPVVLTLRAAGRRREFWVENETTGVEPGNLNRLFERFYRPDASRSTETGGHGIGLSVARAITEAHRGKISAASADGVHIRFTALL